MAEARNRSIWNPASSILSMLFNAHRNARSTTAKTASDFNPYSITKKSGPPIVSTGDLIAIFGKKKPPCPPA